MEGDSKRKADVILGAAAEAGHEVVKLGDADGHHVIRIPVITATDRAGKSVARDLTHRVAPARGDPPRAVSHGLLSCRGRGRGVQRA